MKIWTTLLTTTLLIFSAGSSVSAPATPGMGLGASSSLMKALTSSQAEMLSRGGENVSVIFVQPRDGESTVRNVEALDTLYLLTRQTLQGGIGLILIFETDKTNNALRLLRYRQQEGWWIGAKPYNPADLPDIDFQEAYRLVKAEAGKAHPITQIGILYAEDEGLPLIVVFSVKDEELSEGLCQEWVYTYDATGTAVHEGMTAGCYFDMDNLGASTSTVGYLE